MRLPRGNKCHRQVLDRREIERAVLSRRLVRHTDVHQDRRQAAPGFHAGPPRSARAPRSSRGCPVRPGQLHGRVVHSVPLDLRDIECMIEALREVRSPTSWTIRMLDLLEQIRDRAKEAWGPSPSSSAR
jgi:hypothetical protein